MTAKSSFPQETEIMDVPSQWPHISKDHVNLFSQICFSKETLFDTAVAIGAATGLSLY